MPGTIENKIISSVYFIGIVFVFYTIIDFLKDYLAGAEPNDPDIYKKLILSAVVIVFCISIAVYLHKKILMEINHQPLNPVSVWGIALFIPFFSLLFFYRGFDRMEFYPPYFNVEARYCDDISNQIAEVGYWQGIEDIAHIYRIGLAPLYYPIFKKVGYNMKVGKLFFIFYFMGILLLFYFVFQGTFPDANPFYTFVIIFPLSIILWSMRQHLWHPVTMMMSVGIFYLGKLLNSKGITPWIIPSLGLMGLALFLYRGSLLYIPIILTMMIMEVIFNKEHRFRVIILFVLLIILGCSIYTYLDPTYYHRFLHGRASYRITQILLHKWRLRANWLSIYNVLFMQNTQVNLPWIYSFLFLFGITSSIIRFKTCWFSRLSLSGLFWIIPGMVLTFGMWAPSDNAYLMIFLLGIILLGIKEINCFIHYIIGKKYAHYAMACLIIFIIGCGYDNNTPPYYSITPYYARNDIRTYGAYALLDIQEKLLENHYSVIYLVHKDQIPPLEDLEPYMIFRKIIKHKDVVVISDYAEIKDILQKGKKVCLYSTFKISKQLARWQYSEEETDLFDIDRIIYLYWFLQEGKRNND